MVGPDWLDTDRYDWIAKARPGTRAPQRRQMLQGLLEERFRLKAHRETRQTTAWVLVVAKGGSKLEKGEGTGGGYQLKQESGVWHMTTTTSPNGFAAMLSGLLREPVVDQTGGTGLYAIHIQWEIPEDWHAMGFPPDAIGRAVEKHLGLALDRKKVAMDFLVVDHVERTRVEN